MCLLSAYTLQLSTLFQNSLNTAICYPCKSFWRRINHVVNNKIEIRFFRQSHYISIQHATTIIINSKSTINTRRSMINKVKKWEILNLIFPNFRLVSNKRENFSHTYVRLFLFNKLNIIQLIFLWSDEKSWKKVKNYDFLSEQWTQKNKYQ